VVIGDVVGHDNEAVAAMGQLRSLLRGIAVSTGADGSASSPATLLRGLERAVDLLETGAMASLVVARLEPADDGAHALHWSNAGHPPPLLVEPDGVVRALSAPRRDLFVGVAVDATRTDSVVTVAPGTTVLLYTDGLVERRDRSARDGIEELQDALRDLAHLELEELCDAVLARMVPDGAQDDVALLAVQVRPARSPAPGPAGPPTQRALGTAATEPEARGERFPIGPDTPLADARGWAAERAEALGAAGEQLVLVTLLTSEVVSNATRHGDGVGRLEVIAVDGGVRISVSDDGEGLPQVLHPDAGTPGGRGVWLVSELARAWGVDRLPGGGKAVWFEVGTGGGGAVGGDDARPDDVSADDVSADAGPDAVGEDAAGRHDGNRHDADRHDADHRGRADEGGGNEVGDESGDAVAVLVLAGHVDADGRDELMAAVDAVLATGRPVVVRCEGLEFIDSTGLAGLSRLAAASPARPRVVAAPEHLRRILRLTGLDALLDLA
jgi:anti-anti-sigma factor